jgi:hypothetical protein
MKMTEEIRALKKATKEALKVRNSARSKIRQNNPASIEAFKKADADYGTAHKREFDALLIHYDVVDEFETLSARVALRKQ